LIIYGKPRFLGYLSFEEEAFLERGTWVHAQTERGEELVVVIGKFRDDLLPEEYKKSVSREHRGQSHVSDNSIQKVDFIAKASPNLLEERTVLEKDEAEILSTARKILRKHDLAMKLVDAEFLLEKKKLFLYFTSEDRVDFRSYVRDLAREFKTRIELRQIGIRDEARVVGGLASCGRPCCCSYWLHQFSPICIRMVKEQNLALNPTKISGICGRLMCCMSYEHFMYKELWDHLPNPGTKIRGPEVTYILSGVDIATESIRIFGMGREIVIPVNKYEEFCSVIQEGKEWQEEKSPGISRKTLVAPLLSEKAQKKDYSPSIPQGNSVVEKEVQDTSEKLSQNGSSKKKLQRKKKNTSSKTLGGNSSEKKEEKRPSRGPRKERGGKGRGEENSRGTQKGASPKERPSKVASEKLEGSPKPQEGKQEVRKKKSSRGRLEKERAPEATILPSSGKKEETQNLSQRKRRRRPRKRVSLPDNNEATKGSHKKSVGNPEKSNS